MATLPFRYDRTTDVLGERRLGPDALDAAFDVAAMRTMLDGRRGSIKSALMNQRLVAGLGNVYSDETLFQASVLPSADADGLGKDRVRYVHREMLRVLRAAIDARVEHFPDWFLLPLRGEGGPCPKCGTELESAEISGRTSWFCPGHQEP